MDKSAIQQIQESANIPEVIRHVANIATVTPLAVIPNSMSVESLEKYMPFASRYRLNMKTTSIDDFMLYGATYDEEGATCFVDAESMSAKTIFDLGLLDSPGHKEHTASLTLKKTAVFNAVIEVNGNQRPQKKAGEFIEDWADFITVYSKDGTEMSPAVAAQKLQDLTIESARELSSRVDDFGESMSAMERVEAKNKALLPAIIDFKCVPYNGLEERTFRLRVSILTGGDKPAIVFRVLCLEAIEERIAEEFKDKLVTAFKGLELETFIGTV